MPVDTPSTRNGEDPPSEIITVSVETIERAPDIDPHLARDILGRSSAPCDQQAKDLRLVDPPQRRDRVPIAGTCPLERLDVSDVPGFG
jgi:hypothetical protein